MRSRSTGRRRYVRRLFDRFCFVVSLCLFSASLTHAQVDTGRIVGIVSDNSGAGMPGVAVTLSGETLIGGTQTQTTDDTGNYHFDRLPPGAYRVKFELSGFKSVERTDVRISAAFTATINVPLEVGAVEETITVEGGSPTVDTKSNVQQTVMGQELLEGIPTGRDPWSLAKIIPGVQISTYDVGGTQSYQQSNMSAHGSMNADKTFSIDGLAVNWPGSDGGSTMIYYDQGMFEEVNYQTSAIPAEVAIGGIYMNMVSKAAGNKWRGDVHYNYANDSFQSDNSGSEELKRFNFPGGNPIQVSYDFNVSGGGALMKDKLWVNGSLRKWVVNKDNLIARNPDGTPTLDDNDLKNYMVKGQYQVNSAQRLSVTFNWNNKIRGHRRDPPPNYIDDVASLVQTNPGSSTQAKYNAVLGKLVYESNGSLMLGRTIYSYQPGTAETDIRVEDSVLSTASVAAPRHEEQPNYRVQFDNSIAYATQGFGGFHSVKGGVQYARLKFDDSFEVNGDRHILFASGAPNSVRIYNTPVSNLSFVNWYGFFLQDAWSIGSRLTLNVGGRFDWAKGSYPAQSAPAGNFVPERSINGAQPTNQKIFVWRTGLAYDLFGHGQTALKVSASRYANQVGINRVQLVHPFQFTNGTRTWADTNGDRQPQLSELGAFSGFADNLNRYADPNGPDWPYSDEFTAGVEHELVKDVRVSAMYYHRTNRKVVGFRNSRVPSNVYTPVTVDVPGGTTGPGGTVTFYNLDSNFFGLNENIYDNDPTFDNDYNGFELTANKRMSNNWQMLLGLTLGKNKGGVITTASDLNDPNFYQNYPDGVVGDDSKYALRVAGSYILPYGITASGSWIWNQGYPYQSTYTVTRSIFPGLVRASQVVRLSQRGDERLNDVAMVDLRFSKAFSVGGRYRISPTVDIYNLTNSGTVVRLTPGVGTSYLAPAEILAPRVIKIGVSATF